MNNFARDLSNQTAASIIQDGITRQELLKAETIENIVENAAKQMADAQHRLSESLECIDNVRDFASNPSGILGSMATKHGEIAEHVEVEIRNGRSILNGLRPDATFDGVGRTAPEDYIIQGLNVQSKFINGFNNSLKAVIGHLDKYPNFTSNGYYHIPRDQFDIINRIANGETVEGLSTHSISKCNEFISIIEKQSGKQFSEVVFPGTSNYAEVQLGTIDRTLDGYEDEFQSVHKEQVSEIQQERDAAKSAANHISDFSIKDGLRYGAISAAITGGVSAALTIYSKIKGGKKISAFTTDDWKDVGIDAGKNGLKGGISGIGIYTLSKGCNFSAPFAGAVASAAVGISSLLINYRKGKLTEQDFSSATNALCVEAGLSAVGAAVGQCLIPIPILGAVIGTAVAKASVEVTRYICNKDEARLIERMESEYNSIVASLSVEAKEIIAQMDSYYKRLGGYIEAALSIDAAERLNGAVELCRFLEVPESDIIHNTNEMDELDDFILR